MTPRISAEALARQNAARRPNGEYGPQHHSAPTPSQLTPVNPDDNTTDEFTNQLLNHDHHRARTAELLRKDHLTASERYELTQELARIVRIEAARYGRRRGLRREQIEDFSQEALVKLMEALDRDRAKNHDINSPDRVREMLTSGGLLRRMMISTSQWEAAGGRNNVRSTDLHAYALLQTAEQEFHETHGRPMNTKERDTAAEAIRLRWKPGLRPTDGFQHRKLGHTSLDMPVGEHHDTTLGDLLPAETPTVTERERTLHGAATILDEFEHDAATWKLNTELPNKKDYRGNDAGYQAALTQRNRYVADHPKPRRSDYGLTQQHAWGLLSSQLSIPDVQRGSLNRQAAKTARAATNAYPGGAHQLAADWLDGTSSAHDAASLFAPFGGDTLTTRERDQIAAVFFRNKHLADRLYQVAVTGATARTRT